MAVPALLAFAIPAIVSAIGSMFSTISANRNADEAATQALELQKNNQEWEEEQAQKQMDFQTSANKIAMDFSHNEAEIQRGWLENMSNTSYQRSVKDLQAAGLNPILAYSQGGASVPSISSASGISSAGALANLGDYGQGAVEALKQKSSNSMVLAQSFINTASQVAMMAMMTATGKKPNSVIGFTANR